MLAEQSKTLVEQTKKAVEVIEKYGFQSVISISANRTGVAVHIYDETELNGFDFEVLTAEERDCEYDEIFVILDGVKVLTLVDTESTLQIA